jgi:hypothetical protein
MRREITYKKIENVKEGRALTTTEAGSVNVRYLSSVLKTCRLPCNIIIDLFICVENSMKNFIIDVNYMFSDALILFMFLKELY